jgi:cation diffusion facilitator family transporter
MDPEKMKKWMHDHSFGQETTRRGERRTHIVIGLTLVTMVVEIAAGMVFGSMALLADGLHMGSHASALAIAAFAYFYTRRHARDPRFNFGTGKVNTLAAFASAILLAVFALFMVFESIHRFISPVEIEFNQAILVAVVGLIVNGVSLIFLQDDHDHGHEGHAHHRDDEHKNLHRDQNLWAAYIHVMADALTSVLAIIALLMGKYFGLNWLDPMMGLVGAGLIFHWSINLVRSSSHVLLDMQAPDPVGDEIRQVIESKAETHVADLHVWSVGPGIYAAEIAIIAPEEKSTEYYVSLLPEDLGLVHVTIQTHMQEGP